MSEITPNTPNPVREDSYKNELATKLGIDPEFIPPSPVWRNEEEIKAIAEMFSNMSGGSGGGVLVVHVDVNMDTMTFTLDKTWKEIKDAGFAVAELPPMASSGNYVKHRIQTISIENETDYLIYIDNDFPFDFITDNENGYPSYTASVNG